MLLVRQRTQLKNSTHATLAKYALTVVGISDLFEVNGENDVGEANQLSSTPDAVCHLSSP
jgi:hypothetical protein